MSHPALLLDKVSRVYGDGPRAVHALIDVSLSVDAGTWVGLKGRSGSGKTTLLNCIGGLDRPTRGSILANDTAVHSLGEAALTQWRRLQVGYVFQSFALMPTLSASENVELPLRIAGKLRGSARRDRVAECLALVGLTKWGDHRPGEMSGGQQQRVAMARALVNKPRLLLADEPTGELDTNTARDILALLRRIVVDEGVTLVMTSHDPMALDHTDRVIELADGRLVEPIRNREASALGQSKSSTRIP